MSGIRFANGTLLGNSVTGISFSDLFDKAEDEAFFCRLSIFFIILAVFGREILT